MKKYIILLSFLICAKFLSSTNKFIYFHYDHSESDVEILIEKINDIIASSDKFCIFYSNSRGGEVVDTEDKLQNLFRSMRDQQTSFYPLFDEEIKKINNIFVDLLNEHTEETKIIGDKDAEWECVFLLPVSMYQDNEFGLNSKIPYKLIFVNQLTDRQMSMRFMAYINNDIEIQHINTNIMKL